MARKPSKKMWLLLGGGAAAFYFLVYRPRVTGAKLLKPKIPPAPPQMSEEEARAYQEEMERRAKAGQLAPLLEGTGSLGSMGHYGTLSGGTGIQKSRHDTQMASLRSMRGYGSLS